MYTFKPSGPVVASIDLSMGNIRILAGDGEILTVRVEPSNPAKAADVRSAESTHVEFAGDRLEITQPKSLRTYTWFSSGSSIDLVVHLPSGSRIGANTAYGSIRTEGALGPSNLKTSYGDITVEEGEDLRLRTAYGKVVLDHGSGHTDIRGGKVRVGQLDGTAAIRSAEHGTHVGLATGDLRVASSYGNIEVDRALATVVAKTAYGKVRIHDALRGAIEMRSSYGELELGIREGSAAWLDLETGHGTVRNNLTATDSAPGASTDTLQVTGRTSHGDIIIGRARPVR